MSLIAYIKDGAVKSNNFKDGVDKIGALTLISLSSFPLPLLSSVFPVSLLLSPCDKEILKKKKKETMNEGWNQENDRRLVDGGVKIKRAVKWEKARLMAATEAFQSVL